MKQIKKSILLSLISLTLLLPSAALAINIVIPIIGWGSIIDGIVKGVRLMECDFKGRCQTKEYPKPGYNWDNFKYWSENDLPGYFKRHTKDFGFISQNPPADAVAALPGKEVGAASVIYSSGTSAQDSKTKLNFGNTIKKSWSKFNKGDLIFNDGTKFACTILEPISNWTHVGMIYDTSIDNPQVFDALPFRKAAKRNAIESFGDAYAYSVKRVKGISADQANHIIEMGKARYEDRPYSPSLMSAIYGIDTYAVKWADRNDTSSLNCAKLVYHIFKDAGINLASNRTISRMVNSTGREYCEGKYQFIDNAWIGITPDDIYYSKNLERDKYLEGRLRGMNHDFAKIAP
ncbi:MAG: hypothetical protein NT099_08475 [Candidatus Saganbacteria bacterium]|nr:hypothetical protein [Candidatus Saganbacteria bacterium]